MKVTSRITKQPAQTRREHGPTVAAPTLSSGGSVIQHLRPGTQSTKSLLRSNTLYHPTTAILRTFTALLVDLRVHVAQSPAIEAATQAIMRLVRDDIRLGTESQAEELNIGRAEGDFARGRHSRSCRPVLVSHQRK